MTAALSLPLTSHGNSAVVGCVVRLVVLLRVCGDDAHPVRLLPSWGATSAAFPIVGRRTPAPESGDNLGGGVISNLVSEGHARILPRKNKSAMPKIILANRRHCRHITRMSNNTTAKFERGQQVKIEGHIARITGQTTIGKKSGETFWAVEVARLQVNEWGRKAKITGWGQAQWVRESRIEA